MRYPDSLLESQVSFRVLQQWSAHHRDQHAQVTGRGLGQRMAHSTTSSMAGGGPCVHVMSEEPWTCSQVLLCWDLEW